VIESQEQTMLGAIGDSHIGQYPPMPWLYF